MILNTGDSAVFSDASATPLSIFQTGSLPLGFGQYRVTFDFLDGLSPDVPFGFLADSFFSTLYLGRVPFGSTLVGGTYDEAIGLFDLDAAGLFNVVPGGSFGPSPKGAAWTRFTYTGTEPVGSPAPTFATIAFESHNLNGRAADSVVAVDNVSITVELIPEPGSATLLLLGTTCLIFRRRRISLPS